MDIYEHTKKEFIKKAESLKPELYTSQIRVMQGSPSKALNKGDSVVFDFGNHYVGNVRFRCSAIGSHPDAPAFVKIKFCETAREIEADSSTYEGWISKGWIQEEWLHIDWFPTEVMLPRRYAFRYVKLEVIDVSNKFSLVIDSMEAETFTSACAGQDEKQPCIRAGAEIEESIDVTLDRISRRTLQNCMQDVFEDGPKRDRRLWIGDLRLQALANYETFCKNDLVKRCLYLFAGTANEEGRVSACLFTKPEIERDDTFMFDYSLFFIPTLLDYLDASNDFEAAEELLETAFRQLELSRKYFGENHLIQDSDIIGWCFLDWNLELNKQAGAQSVYIYCEKAMIQLLERLGKTERIPELRQDVALKEAAALEYLYDGEQGLFVSGVDGQISYASQVWAVLAEIGDKEAHRGILERIKNIPNAVGMVTPYMYHHYVMALIEVGEKQQAYEVMREYWGKMAADGADTFYELFNPKNPEESPYGSSVVNSYCHAWSCTPTYFMRKWGLTEKECRKE